MIKKILIGSVLVIGAGVLITSCETISEDQCFATDWADRGYKDGTNGAARSKLSDYIDKCSEFGADVNRARYLDGFEAGLERYCTYDKGFSRGEGGSSYNAVCEGPRAGAFRAGYDDGTAKYEYERKYDNLLDAVRRAEEQYEDVTHRLKDQTLSADERLRLEKKRRRYKDRIEDTKHELYKFERKRGY